MNFDPTIAFEAQTLTLATGQTGKLIEVASANPLSYEAIIADNPGLAVRLFGSLFLPKPAATLAPVVILIPGSGGVNPSILSHAQALLTAGIGALVLDPFGGRGVQDTIAAQQQFSFASSSWDVFACMKRLAEEPGVDVHRLAAMGYSRGGLAVIQAAMKPLADAVLQRQPALAAVVAGWPWCGYQFSAPDIGRTAMRLIAADQDNWASVLQVQAQYFALRARGADISMRLVANASHGFGYSTEFREFPEAMTALAAPVVEFNESGVLVNPWNRRLQPGASDLTIRDLLLPFIRRGVSIGTRPGQMQDFMNDFTSFFQARLIG
jgi:dienelactone hydrolase